MIHYICYKMSCKHCISLILLLTYTSAAAGLSCEWKSGDGKLTGFIISGSPKTVSATDETRCKAQCMQQTSFICASVNYNGGTQSCELLAENDQTATSSTSGGEWRYSIRPLCAGLWKPWTAVKGKYLNSGVDKYASNTDLSPNLRDCMTFCLQDVSSGYNCSSVVKAVGGGNCELVDKRSDDAGVTPEGNSGHQYFNLPLWYSDNVKGATNTDLREYGSGGLAFLLLVSYEVEVDGYLVAWKYTIGRTTNYCDSYAAIWRQTGSGSAATYRRVTETLLRPEDPSTGGVRFQFVQDSRKVVRKGDFLAVYVNDASCGDGNLVSFNSDGPPAYIRKYSEGESRAIVDTITNVGEQKRNVALRGYIAELFKLSENPRAFLTDLSGQIRLTWQLPDGLSNEELTGTGFVKIECADDSNFNNVIVCHPDLVPINNKQTVISSLDIHKPHYARLSTVRNYNGEGLVENRYSVNNNSPFCTERGRLTSGDIIVAESGILKPGEKRTIEVSIPSLKDDNCVSTVTLTYDTGMLENEDRTGPWTFSKDQGVSYTLTITVTLLDGHNSIIWQDEYKTSKASLLPPPEDLMVETRTSTSASLSWTSVDYTNKQQTIQKYQVDCKVINNTYNNQPVLNSVNVYTTTDSSTTSLTIQEIYSQVKYSCTVKALLASDGLAETSVAVEFWTKPEEMKPEFNTEVDVVVSNQTITIPLPQLSNDENVLGGYDSLVVAVERLSSRRRRSITAERIDDVNVYIAAAFPITSSSSSFEVGDNMTYGGYWNRPLEHNFYYYIAVGFKSKTEQNVLKFYTIPGAEKMLFESSSTDPTDNGVTKKLVVSTTGTTSGGNTGAIVGAVIGGICALVIAVVLVTYMKRRKSSTPKSLALDTHASRPLSTEKPIGAVSPNNIRRLPSAYPNTSDIKGKKAPPDDATYENVKHVEVPSLPIATSQLHSVIQNEKTVDPENPFKEEFQRIGAPPLQIEIGRNPENVKKNRFKDIIATDGNRVILKVAEGYDSDYVNANYIQDYHGRNRFIASQGPNEHTVEDMWRLIHDSNTSTVVMLTNPVEAARRKCEIYWAVNTKDPVVFGQFQISLVEEQQFAEYVVRKLKYVYNKQSRHVRQYHFTQWPDHGVPTTSGLLSFRHRVKQDTGSNAKPTLVHCSAGVGRTGTFIGLDILIEEAAVTSAKGADATVDVQKCVHNMRCQRTKMIQTLTQYTFLYEVLAEALDCGNSSVVCSKFSETFKTWRLQKRGQMSILEKQLEKINSHQLGAPCSAGLDEPNINKNRDAHILPIDEHRVRLPYFDPDRTDYINAVFCDGYQTKRGFIVTQTPLADTEQDFWQMIVDNRCPVILYFNDCQQEKPYWPDKIGEQIQSGKMKIQSIPTEDMNSLGGDGGHYSETKLRCTSGKVKHGVTIVELKVDKRQLPSPNQLITLCNKLERFATSGKDVITVQCSDGARLSGVFVVAMNLYLRTRIEQEVDIVLEVKLARRSRSQFISDFKSFDLLYEFISSYLSDFGDYSNFR